MGIKSPYLSQYVGIRAVLRAFPLIWYTECHVPYLFDVAVLVSLTMSTVSSLTVVDKVSGQN